MARLPTLTIALLFSAVAGFQYTGTASGQSSGDGWITLFDGKNLDQWQGEAGNNATWRIEDGSVAHGENEGDAANFAFVEPEPEYGPVPFCRHSACTIC